MVAIKMTLDHVVHSSVSMSDFSSSDPYDAASAWCCFFICDSCNVIMEFASAHPRGLNYYREQGQRAKTEGWYVADESTATDVRYVVRCPECAKASGLTLPWPSDRIRPHPAVLTICWLTALPEERQDG